MPLRTAFRSIRRRLERLERAIPTGDEFADLLADDTIMLRPGDPEPLGLAAFLARDGVVLRPDEPIPANPIL